MPSYSHNNATVTGPGTAINIVGPTAPGNPPVLTCTGTGVVFNIENSDDNSRWNVVGAFTAPVQKDLITNVPFWRTNITNSNGGTAFTSSVGPCLRMDGGYWQPGQITSSYSAGL